MNVEDRLLMKPKYTLVYHKDVGCSIQLLLKEISKDGFYVFEKLEDFPLTAKEVEENFEIIQL